MSGRPQKPNSGALFSNKRRRGDKDPTHNGSATIGGQEYWISAWVNEDRNGGRYFSLRFNPKMASEHQGGSRNPPAQTGDIDPELNDDVPF